VATWVEEQEARKAAKEWPILEIFVSSSSATTFNHRGLGAMIRLILGDGPSFDLTPLEARTLSRALAAVSSGKSKVDEVYMSPIASDHDFFAKVVGDGLLLEAFSPAIKLGWEEVGKIAHLLAELAPEPPAA
jgi:hypothetical protein